MRSLNSLTRKLEKLETATRAKHAPPDYAVIFYDMHRPDKDAWIEQETRRVLLEQGNVRTLFIMPNKETYKENAARYAAYRE
jgi:hypothetical protein